MKSNKFLFYILLAILIICIILPTNLTFATSNNIDINAPVGVLIESSTGKIIYEKNAHKRMYPASTTKIMTAIITLENCNLTDTSTVSSNAINSVPFGYSHANLQEGEILTIEQLLYTLLIPSANDSANVLAEHISGSIENFATIMNQKAKELGCKNTNFVNPSGIHNDSHYSTAYDLALIGQYAMKNDIFRKIVMTSSYSLPITNKYDKENRTFNMTNKLVNPASKQYYKYATGIKTGYTDPAKNCLVASAKKDDLELICVILNAENDDEINTNRFFDSTTLFKYGFDNFTTKNLALKDSIYKVIRPRNATKETSKLDILYENNITAFLNKINFDKEFSPEIELHENISAPIKKGEIVGKISYNIDGINYTTNLISGQDVENNSVATIILRIIGIILLLYILSKFLNKKNNRKKRMKNRSKKYKNTASSPYIFKY
ncbi:MAG: D-alanyl-D-alanine carboxypeptidase [Clostridia bacterium]|nr:D-alanyl-D-alanine carboxypeptidase [Clostridia bacterium]